ncbi:2,5-diketo-d-gluconic acid reductase [Lentilactobacillus kosonis]|uniref:2,5-diketo-d-gluconic acid reductase n=1 Tax=Lentilactobacillus kosonis TaxID=2810561 RepID=A0A401FJ47_9LACO|nr:2,5-diketo-d-gluconic acid reductase [Lentilactobacillus kosonis]
MRWHEQKEIIPIPKSVNLNHQRLNLETFDFNLTNDEMDAIDSLTKSDGRIDNQDPNEYEEFE